MPGVGQAHFLVISLSKFLMMMLFDCLSSVANRFLATKTAPIPLPRRESPLTSPRPLSFGNMKSS